MRHKDIYCFLYSGVTIYFELFENKLYFVKIIIGFYK